jgi:hypothetical protein
MLGRRAEAAARLMRHSQADSTGGQRTPGRYRLADKAVSRMGYGAMQLPGDGVFGPPPGVTGPLLSCAAVDVGVDHIDTAQTRTVRISPRTSAPAGCGWKAARSLALMRRFRSRGKSS